MPRFRPLPAIVLASLATAQQYEWRRATDPAPQAGGSGQLVYDSVRKRMVCLLGAETLLGDGAVWRSRGTTPAGSLHGPGLAFDRARGVTFLFGGAGASGSSAQTWQWNGAAWSQVATAASPSARTFSPLAYDVLRQRIVLYGGTTSLINDTWEFDGTNWSQRSPLHSPNAHGRHGLVYDEARQIVVLFGGTAANGQTLLAETWEWDGTDWTQRSPAQSPPARRNHGMAYDALRARTVVFGGVVAGANVTDTWQYDGATWIQAAIGLPAPPSQTSHSLAGDPDRGGVVSVEASGGALRTWTFDGATWRLAIPSLSPDTRDLHAMAHDPVRGETLLFGQTPLYAFPAYEVTSWIHRGGAWVQRFPATSPPFTSMAAMAHDPAGGGILMFGGIAAGSLSATTWRWDGLDWQSLPSSPGPPPRSASAMAADLGRGRVVMFGGEGTGGWRNDTWEWNGASWQQRFPAQSPPPREGHAMAYDPLRARTVLFGGGDLLQVPTLGDHWEWNGTTWTLRPAIVPGPPSRRQTTAAHDEVLGRTLLFGGQLDVDAWLLGPVSAAAVVGYGSGCPGTFGLPEVRAVGQPFVGNPWFAVQGSALVPGAFALLGVSTVPANQPLPGGCTALIDQPSWFGGVANARGALDVPLPIPNLASLRGAAAFAQLVAVDAQGAFQNLVALSAGLRVTLD